MTPEQDRIMNGIATRLEHVEDKVNKLETSVMGDARNPSVFESLRTLNATMHNMNKTLNTLIAAVESITNAKATLRGVVTGVGLAAGLVGWVLGYLF